MVVLNDYCGSPAARPGDLVLDKDTRSCRSVAADGPIIAPVDAISAVAARTISAITIAPMHPDRAVRTSAASAIGAASADDGVSFRYLNGEQAENQQAGSDEFHWVYSALKL
jgi:hypothetical protein